MLHCRNVCQFGPSLKRNLNLPTAAKRGQTANRYRRHCEAFGRGWPRSASETGRKVHRPSFLNIRVSERKMIASHVRQRGLVPAAGKEYHVIPVTIDLV